MEPTSEQAVREALAEMEERNAAIIGVLQGFAALPGVSRSGGTITTGLALGYKRDDAARFSFLMSVPIIVGAGVKKTYDVVKAGHVYDVFTYDSHKRFPRASRQGAPCPS